MRQPLPVAVMPTTTLRLALVLSLLFVPQQVFRSGTELVEVDVVVLDDTGRVVRGLTADDFELYDEGRRQEVSTFSFVDVEPALTDVGGTVLAEPGVASSAVQRAAGIYLIVLDHVFSPPQRRTEIRRAARAFVADHMRPDDLAAVIHLGLSSGGIEFSGNKAQLLAAIDGRTPVAEAVGANPTPAIVPSGGDDGSPDGIDAGAEIAEVIAGLDRFENHLLAETAEKTYEMLELAAEYVSGFTGRRKSMLLFSSGVPIDMGYVGTDLGLRERSTRFASAHQRLIQIARQANVAVYAIETEGLGSEANRGGSPIGGHHEGAPDRTVFALADTMIAKSAEDSLRALALETGGRAVLRYNNLSEPFGQIVRDNSAFYLLGFRPGTSDPKKFRKLDVRVKREGVQVFARPGYGGTATRNRKMAETLARAWAGETVADLLARPLPGRTAGLSMRAQAAVVSRTETGAAALLLIEVDPGSMPAHATKLEVGYRAISAGGDQAAGRVDATNMQVSARTREAIDANGWRYLTRVDLPPGLYQVRIAAREETSGAYGTVFLDLTIPDLTRAAAVIDSIVIGSNRAAATPTAAPTREMLQAWPVLPTTRRTFSKDETLAAFIQLASTQVQSADVRFEVLNADGNVIGGSTQTASAANLTPGAAPIVHQLPLVSFAPGDYVLRVTITPPNAPEPSDTRTVPFRVEG